MDALSQLSLASCACPAAFTGAVPPSRPGSMSHVSTHCVCTVGLKQPLKMKIGLILYSFKALQ